MGLLAVTPASQVSEARSKQYSEHNSHALLQLYTFNACMPAHFLFITEMKEFSFREPKSTPRNAWIQHFQNPRCKVLEAGVRLSTTCFSHTERRRLWRYRLLSPSPGRDLGGHEFLRFTGRRYACFCFALFANHSAFCMSSEHDVFCLMDRFDASSH